MECPDVGQTAFVTEVEIPALLDNAPVVYLNSEAEGSRVVANNLSEFLTLLACDEEPIFGEYPDTPDGEREHSPRNQAFRQWLEQHYHLQFARKPNEVVHSAEQKYPSLPLIY